jgi:hypothetical protein
MNKHLNNWMDEAEGLPINTTNLNITKELKRQGYTLNMKKCLLCEDRDKDPVLSTGYCAYHNYFNQPKI